MNKVILIGRFTRDPEVKYTDGGATIARFSLAVDRRYKAEGAEQTADFISCIAFGKTAEFIEKYFFKGMKAGIEGRIQTGSYTNKDNQKVYTTDVVVEQIEFTESKNTSGNGNSNTNSSDSDGFMNIPDEIDEELPFN